MRRIRSWFGRRDGDYADEIRAHIDMEAAEYEARGMAPAAARDAARRAFGNPESIRETLREARPGYWLDTVGQDVRYGIRLLRRSPGLALAVFATLTFGIGLCSTIFTIVNAEVFRAKVDGDPAGFLSVIPAYSSEGARRSDPGRASLDDFHAMRATIAPLAVLAGWERIPVALDRLDAPPFNALLVTCEFFSVWGLDRPRLGRLFSAEECATPGSAPVAVISEEIWRSQFDGDPGILGKTFSLNRQSLTVVGVVPARWSGRQYRNTEVWIPYTMQPRFGFNQRLAGGGQRDRFRQSGAPWLEVAGRLHPGVSRSAVQAALTVVAARQDALNPGRKTELLVTDGSVFGNRFERGKALWVTTLIVFLLTLVMVIVCANVTLLLLSRAAARGREMAVRLSLGAGWTRLVRMLLTESMLLAGAAGGAAAWLSWRCPEPIRTLLAGEPATYSMAPDWRTFLYLAAITLFAGGIAGLTPALESLRADLARTLKDDGLFSGRGRSRGFLVAAQVATSVVVLTFAWMLLQANRLYRSDPGFDAERVATRSISVKSSEPARTLALLRRSLESRAGALPGVTSVAFADEVRQTDVDQIRVPGGPARPVTARNVSPGFFRAMGIPLAQGRELTADEEGSAIVSESLARALWPGENALGKTFAGPDGASLRVAGVSHTLPRSYFTGTEWQVFRLLGPDAPTIELIVRFEGTPGPVARSVAGILRDLDPNLFGIPTTLQAQAARAGRGLGVLSDVAVGVGVVVILLALFGIYGVAAYSIRRRARELGIRVALGARRPDIVSLVCLSGMRPVWIGLIVGLLASVAGGRVALLALSHSGVPVRAGEPIAYAGSALLIALAAAAAMAGPAFRAARTDPIETLRHE